LLGSATVVGGEPFDAPLCEECKMKFISTRVHGMMDYLSVLILFVLPRMLNWSDRATTLFTILAVITLVYSLVTRYELGLFGLLPMPAHLVMDFLSGALLCAAALMLPDEPGSVRGIMAAFGLFEIGAALLSESRPSGRYATDTGTRARGH
jgi:hypothetical protein